MNYNLLKFHATYAKSAILHAPPVSVRFWITVLHVRNQENSALLHPVSCRVRPGSMNYNRVALFVKINVKRVRVHRYAYLVTTDLHWTQYLNHVPINVLLVSMRDKRVQN